MKINITILLVLWNLLGNSAEGCLKVAERLVTPKTSVVLTIGEFEGKILFQGYATEPHRIKNPPEWDLLQRVQNDYRAQRASVLLGDQELNGRYAKWNVVPEPPPFYWGVQNLPNLEQSFYEAMEGPIFRGYLYEGAILYQAQRAGQKSPGRWFTPTRPRDSEHADELLHIFVYGNKAEVIKVYKLSKDVRGYGSLVAGGKGYQLLIPTIEEVEQSVEELGILYSKEPGE